MSAILQDLRQAARSLRRAPGFTLIAASTLGLGIGSSVTASVYLDYLKRPALEAPDPSRLRFVYQATQADPRGGFSTPDFRDLADSRALATVAGWRMFSASLAWPDATRHVWGHAVSGDYFATFAARATLGRMLEPDDDREGAEPVVVLGHRFWRDRLNADPGVVGQSVTLDGRYPYRIVGITAEGFQGEGFGTAAYLPLGTASWLRAVSDRSAPLLTVLGRLPSAGEREAETRLAVFAASLNAAHPRNEPRRLDLVEPHTALAWAADDPMVRGAELLGLAVLVLLVLGTTNTATLMLARATVRRREWAVRSAMGASRLRLGRATLMECAGVATLGLAFGFPLAVALLRVVEWYLIGTTAVGLGDWSTASHLPIDWRSAARVAGGLAVASAVLCWLASFALQLREDLTPALKADGESVEGSSRLRLGGRRALVVAQGAMSTSLLVVAMLSIGSLRHLGHQSLGFVTENRMLATVHIPTTSTTPGVDAYASLLAEIRDAPGVRAAALADRGPLHPQIGRAEAQLSPEGARTAVTLNAVSENYLAAVGVPLLFGRDLREEDTVQSPPVAMISLSLADAIFPGRSALGERLRLIEPGKDVSSVEIVGVAADSRQGSLIGPIPPHLFLARRQRPGAGRPTIVINTNGPIAEPLRLILRERHPGSALIDLQTLEEQRRRSMADGRMNAELASGMGLLGLVLAAAGLFGLLSFTVSRRTREFSVRRALGAGQSDLVSLVMNDATRLLGVGVAIGLVLAYPLARMVESRLIGVSANDPRGYIAAALVVLTTGLVAAYMPSRRAGHAEPSVALRHS